MTPRPNTTRRFFLRGIATAAAAPLIGRMQAMAAETMITRPIPSSGEAMPVIGLGTWQVFDVGADDKARQPLRQVLKNLTDAGGRMIDSSPMYGRAEEVTGDLVAEAGLRPRVFSRPKYGPAAATPASRRCGARPSG